MQGRDGFAIIAKQEDGLFDDFNLEVVPRCYLLPLEGDDWCLIPDAVVVDEFASIVDAWWWLEHGVYQIEGEVVRYVAT